MKGRLAQLFAIADESSKGREVYCESASESWESEAGCWRGFLARLLLGRGLTRTFRSRSPRSLGGESA